MMTLVLVRVLLATIGVFVAFRWLRTRFSGKGKRWHELSRWRRRSWLVMGCGLGSLAIVMVLMAFGAPADIEQALVPVLLVAGYVFISVGLLFALVTGISEKAHELDGDEN